MSTTTTNLGLVKPDGEEYVDVSVINDNMDKIDTAVGGYGSVSGTDLICASADYSASSYNASWFFYRLHIPSMMSDKVARRVHFKITTSPSSGDTYAYKDYFNAHYDMEVVLSTGIVRANVSKCWFGYNSYRPIYYTVLARDSGNNIVYGVSMASAVVPTYATAKRDITISLMDMDGFEYIEAPTSDDDAKYYITPYVDDDGQPVQWTQCKTDYPLASGSTASTYTVLSANAYGVSQTGDQNNFDRLNCWSGVCIANKTVVGYSLMMMDENGQYLPIHDYTSVSTSVSKNPATTRFDLAKGGLVYCSSSSVYSAGSRYTIYPWYPSIDARYTFRMDNKTYPYMTIDALIYLKGTIDEDGLFTLADLVAHEQSELDALAADDGYVYILVGKAGTSKSYTIYPSAYHPICWYDGSRLRYVSDPQEYVEWKYPVITGKVDDVKVNGVSVVTDKVAEITVPTAEQQAEWSAKQDSLTEAQKTAVDSGITSAKVTAYDGYATTIADKSTVTAVQTLTAGTEIARITVDGKETIIYAPSYTDGDSEEY